MILRAILLHRGLSILLIAVFLINLGISTAQATLHTALFVAAVTGDNAQVEQLGRALSQTCLSATDIVKTKDDQPKIPIPIDVLAHISCLYCIPNTGSLPATLPPSNAALYLILIPVQYTKLIESITPKRSESWSPHGQRAPPI